MEATNGITTRRRVYLDDLDGYGMLHHSRYAVLLDRAVLDFWLDRGWRLDGSTAVQAIRELTIRYHRPITAVGDVDIRFWISSAGRTSVVYSFEFVSPDGSIRYADGTRDLVNLDPRTHAPVSLSDKDWDVAKPLLAPDVERPGTGSSPA